MVVQQRKDSALVLVILGNRIDIAPQRRTSPATCEAALVVRSNAWPNSFGLERVAEESQ